MKIGIYTLAIIFTGITCSSSALADIKIKSKRTMSGQSYENTTYIKGKRQRSESMNGTTISLTQCDLRRGVQLNSQTKTYIVNPFADAAASGKTTAVVDKQGVVQAGGHVTTTITTKDTGERKQMFGFTARRLIITMETVSSADACSKTNTKMQVDGWYVDAAFALDCDYGYQGYQNYSAKSGGCKDRYDIKTIGTAKRGYPVYEKMTMLDDSGKETFTMISEVVELSRATLDAALFEVPADYREVQDASQMYAAIAATSMANTGGQNQTSSTSGLSQSVRSSAQATTTTAPVSVPAAAKQAGVVRIGLAGVKTGAVGDAISASDLAAAIQNSLTSYLKMPNVEIVNIEAKLATAIAAEAKDKECDYVIHATASHKKGGGGGFGSMFGSAVGSAIGATAIGHTGSTAGNVAASVARNAAVSAATVSGNIKSKDELTLDVKLNKTDGAQALGKVYKVKAKSNGDDIISQIIEQAAQDIANIIGS